MVKLRSSDHLPVVTCNGFKFSSALNTKIKVYIMVTQVIVGVVCTYSGRQVSGCSI
jgi:hypothetical protein